MSDHPEFRLLADFVQAAVLPANTRITPIPVTIGGELEQDERGEVVFAEITPPVQGGTLQDEDLRQVTIICDGHTTASYISLSGLRTTCMTPPKERVVNGRLYTFGTPHSNDGLKSTTLKYKHDVTVSCLAGPDPLGVTGAAQPFRVRLWGYVYKTADIPRIFGTMQFPPGISERMRGRIMPLNKAPIAVNGDSWLTLPGGHDQAVPKIMPFARYAYNARATDGVGGDYQFRFNQGGVADENENLYFEFDSKDALLIESLGVTAQNDTLMPPFGAMPALARTGLRIGSDYHPKGPTPLTSLYPTIGGANPANPLVFGRWPIGLFGANIFPFPPFDLFAVIPKLDKSFLIWNEIGYIVVRDDGITAIPLAAPPPALGGVVVAVTGTRIEMRG